MANAEAKPANRVILNFVATAVFPFPWVPGRSPPIAGPFSITAAEPSSKPDPGLHRVSGCFARHCAISRAVRRSVLDGPSSSVTARYSHLRLLLRRPRGDQEEGSREGG